MKVVAVVQARYASQRLPGKVLTRLNGKPAIEWCVDAARRANGVDEVIIATSTNKENDVIQKWADKNGVDCFRGSENDVLDRYIGVIKHTKADAIVRLTADCPMLDSRVIGEVVGLYRAITGTMYCSNTEPPTYPDGLDTEVISSTALQIAHAKATRQTDRDTVTRFIVRNRERFPSRTVTCPIPGLHKERWVLDSPEDLDFLKALIALFPSNWKPNYLDIYETLNRQPHLRTINAKYQRNERFYAGLSEEGGVVRRFTRSQSALARAKKTIPFGAQTFSKSYLQYPPGAAPTMASYGDGGYIFDVDGNDYVDLVSALLPNILGYRDPDVDYAVRHQLSAGASLSLATSLEADLAERLVKHIPCAEMVKLGKNGSDVTSAAVRGARAHTGREHILKYGYHGWHDWTIDATRDLGVPSVAKWTTHPVFRFEQGIVSGKTHPEMVAAVIIEPEGWPVRELAKLKETCREHGWVLIFDEIITGFRWSIGGFQKYIGVTPDLACFGKAMGNGMPISAIVGRADIMARFAPPNNCFYSGTFFGETLSIAAAIATIDKLESHRVIPKLWDTGSLLQHEIRLKLKDTKLDHAIKLHGDAPLLRLAFQAVGDITSEQIKTLFIKEMAANGVLIIASHNLCYAHGPTEVTRVLKAYDATLSVLAKALQKGFIAGEAIQPAIAVR